MNLVENKEVDPGTLVIEYGSTSPYIGVVISLDIWKKYANSDNCVLPDIPKGCIPLRILGIVVQNIGHKHASESPEPSPARVINYGWTNIGGDCVILVESSIEEFRRFLWALRRMKMLPAYLASVETDLETLYMFLNKKYVSGGTQFLRTRERMLEFFKEAIPSEFIDARKKMPLCEGCGK